MKLAVSEAPRHRGPGRAADQPADVPAHRPPRHRGRRPGGQPALRAAAAAVRGGPARRHQPLHQLAGRLGERGPGHLRHDAADPQRRQHAGHGAGREHGPVPAVRRGRGQAVQPAARPGADAPGLGRLRRHRGRHRDLRRAAGAHRGHDDPADLRAHRAAAGAGRARQPARPLVQRRGSARLRDRRSHRGTPRRRAPRACGPEGRACDHEPVHDPHRGGADPGRRAGVRHLLPAAVGAHRLPRHRDRRRGGQRDHGPAAAPRGGQPGPRDQPVHQFPRRLLQRPDRDLRHDAVHPPGRRHHLHGPGVVGGGGAAGRGRAGAAGRAAAREGAAAPAVEPGPGRPARPGRPGQGGGQDPA